MDVNYRLKTGMLMAVVAVLTIGLAGCAERQAYSRGTRAEITRDFETAMAEYKVALDKKPGDIE